MNIDAAGLVTPVKDGEATILIKGPEGKQTRFKVKRDAYAQTVPISFPNQVVPIFTEVRLQRRRLPWQDRRPERLRPVAVRLRAGGGLRVSRQGSARPAHLSRRPRHSLLLLKATGSVAHGGGKRFDRDSAYYRLLRRWIEQGTPYAGRNDPVVQRIEVAAAANACWNATPSSSSP